MAQPELVAQDDPLALLCHALEPARRNVLGDLIDAQVEARFQLEATRGRVELEGRKDGAHHVVEGERSGDRSESTTLPESTVSVDYGGEDLELTSA